MPQVPSYQGGIHQDSGALPVQRSSASPFAFGGGLAEGLGAIAGKLEGASNMLADNAVKIQEGDNKRAVDDGFTQLLQQHDQYINTFKSEKAGTAAYEAYPGAIKDLTKSREEISAAMPNSKAREDFDTASRRQLEYSLSDLTRYANTERKRGLVDSTNGLIEAGKQAAGNAVTDEEFDDKIALIAVNREHQGQLLGEPKELVDAKTFADISTAQRARITRVMNDDPFAAEALYKAHAGQFTAGDAVALEHEIKSAVMPQQARIVADTVFKPTHADPEDDLPSMLKAADAEAERVRPGDEVFKTMTESLVTTKISRAKVAFDTVRRDSTNYLQDQMNKAEEAGHVPSLEDLVSTPQGKAAWANILPTTQRAVLNQLKYAARYRTPEQIATGDKQFLNLRGESLTDPAAFAKRDLASEADLSRTQRMSLMTRQQAIANKKPLNESIGQALSVLNQNQVIQQVWPSAASKNTDEYRQFVGALETKIDTFNATHGRKPNDSDILKMGQGLLTEQAGSGFTGFFGFGKTRAFEVPQAFKDDYVSKFRKAAGVDPTPAQTFEAYTRSQ